MGEILGEVSYTWTNTHVPSGRMQAFCRALSGRIVGVHKPKSVEALSRFVVNDMVAGIIVWLISRRHRSDVRTTPIQSYPSLLEMSSHRFGRESDVISCVPSSEPIDTSLQIGILV